MKIEPKILKGFRDFLPLQARKRQYVIGKLKEVFESFGFDPLETPTLEYEEILTGKYGDEGDTLLYRFEDNGKRRVALRYDQTVPLSRVVAQYQSLLPIPFKRYQIQNVFRAENTQKGRFREFLQCDADIVGTLSPLADAEIIQTAVKCLSVLGFTNYKIILNDRRVFTELIENGSVLEEEMDIAVVAVDKVKKIGKEGVISEMVKKGFAPDRADVVFQLIQKQQKTDTLKDIFKILENIPWLQDKIIFDPTLARGLSYYTGTIFEFEIIDYPIGSVCGGGRYDNLIGMFTGSSIPAVGFALGFDRILEAMDELKLFPLNLINSSSSVLVTIFSEDLKHTSLTTAERIRDIGINTEIYLDEIKSKNPLEKQLKYASLKQIPYVIIIGPEENKNNTITVKNMNTREQKVTTIEDFISEFTVTGNK